MKKLFAVFVLTLSILTTYCQQVNVVGDTAIFNEEGITLQASFTPNTSGTWYWASTDLGLNLATQHGSSLSVIPSDTGVFLFRAVFFNGVRAFVQDFKVTVAPCGAKLTLKDYENQTYRSKRYGSVCWMAQNLRSTLYSPDGTAIPFAHTYNDNESFAEDYGRLYTYNSALNGGTGNSIQGACPDGWQIPMESHLNAVINQNSNTYDYQSGGWLSNGATNTEGFYLYPAGFYNASTSRYENMYGESYLILNTPVVTNNQIRVGGCSHNCPSWLINDVSVNNAYSVRCIKTHPLIDTTRPAPRKLYTIQYIRNGAESGSMAPQTYVDNSNITLAANTFAHSGNWQFTGWNTKADGTGISFTNQQAFTLTQDTILYAQWHTFCTSTPRNNELGTARVDSVKDHQNNWYKVVQIGNQCWLKENMRATTSPSTGNSILQYPAQNTSYTGKRAYYPNDSVSLVARMGVLYNWNAAVDTFNTTHGETSGNTDSGNAVSVNFSNNHRGICPEGWHVPTHNEWQILVDAVDNKAGKLAGGNDWTLHISEMGTPGNYDYTYRNQSGFSAVPASGYSGCYGYSGTGAFFWSATQGVSYGAYARGLGYNSADVFSSTNDNGKFAGYSVRCVRDTIDTLTLKSNNGTGLSTTQYVKRGTPTALNANTFTHEGNWEFIGWSTSDCDNTVAYTDQALITTNCNDTLYAQWHTFCTGTARFTETGSGRIDTVKDHEGNDYTVVQIGNQCWLAENMRCTTSPKGILTEGSGQDFLTPYYYHDANSTLSLHEHGYLYNWAGAMDSAFSTNAGNVDFPNRRGLCPAGWHLPTDAEWQTLEVNTGICTAPIAERGNFRGNNAGRLTGGCDWLTNTTPAAPGNYSYSERNYYGFSALPAGRFDRMSFREYDTVANFWSATSAYQYAYARNFTNYSNSVFRGCNNKNNGFSVRCVRDVYDTLTFMPNGGTGGAMAQQIVFSGMPTAINANTFTHDGNWEFIGWNDACDGNGTHYADAANITTSGNVTLYAQWHSFCTSTPRSNELGTSRVDSVQDHQNNWYKVVQIGNQCWLKENMRCTTSPKGNLHAGDTNKSYYTAYYYDNTSDTKFSFRERGCYYNWAGAIDTNATSFINASFTNRRGICPQGWHLPTDDEWALMESAVAGITINTSSTEYQGSSTDLAVSLSGGCDWSGDGGTGKTPNSNSNPSRNSSGFSALPAGACYGGSFTYAGNDAYFWSATSTSDYLAYYRYLYFSNAGVYRNDSYKDGGFSVRCVRDVVIDTLTFMPNGATGGSMEKQVVVRGVATAIQANTFTHDGNWEFIGWNDACDGNGTNYAAGANITTNGNVTLYAQWHTFCTGTPRSNETGLSRIDSVKDIDNHWYKVVQIDNQCWTKENMRCTTSPKGNLSFGGESGSSYKAYYYDYSDQTLLSLRERGYLYNWAGAMDTNANGYIDTSFTNRRGICPQGWHIPTDTEWMTMEQSVAPTANDINTSSINSQGRATDLAASLSGGCDWLDYNYSGSNSTPNSYTNPNRNSSGFSALPAGGLLGSSFGSVSYDANFWSATSYSGDLAYDRSLSYGETGMHRGEYAKHGGFSVRCVRDESDTITFMPNGATGGAMTQQIVFRGTPTTINANTFTHGGNWEFIGWNDACDGNGTHYADAANITTSGNVTLYAQWHTWCTGVPTAIVETGDARIDSVKDIDNHWYKVVQIGNQCWMKENLKTTKYADNTSIAQGSTTSYDVAYRYYPNNNSSNVSTYGYLYNWKAVMRNSSSSSSNPSGVQGICPTGWHVPSDAEWTQLTNYVSSQSQYVCGTNNSNIAKSLASTTGWSSDNNNCKVGNTPSTNNATGFSAVPAGYYNSDGTYWYLNQKAYYWSATQFDNTTANCWYLNYSNALVYTTGINKKRGVSVRCVCD